MVISPEAWLKPHPGGGHILGGCKHQLTEVEQDSGGLMTPNELLETVFMDKLQVINTTVALLTSEWIICCQMVVLL